MNSAPLSFGSESAGTPGKRKGILHWKVPLGHGLGDVGPLDLGLKPHSLTDEVLMEMLGIILRCRDNIRAHAIFREVK
jgi:hypothetical protein